MNIPIAMVVDRNYINPLKVAIYSTLQHASVDTTYTFYVIHYELEQSDEESLLQFFKDYASLAELNFIKVNDTIVTTIPKIPYADGFSREINFKLFIADLLPHIDKIIFMDADILVQHDLTDLYKIDLTNKAYAAMDERPLVPTWRFSSRYQTFKECFNFNLLLPQHSYVNAGVMLINCHYWRTNHYAERGLKYLIEHQKGLGFPDQDILNYLALQDGIDSRAYFTSEWNFLVALFLENNDLTMYKPKNIQIIHYAGLAPWKQTVSPQNDNEYFNLYVGYAKKVGWSFVPQVIPKVIHCFHDQGFIEQLFTNLGGKTTERICVASWKKHCPDYQIVQWHDKQPEFQEMLQRSRFLRDCYERKLWAFVSDYVRVWVLYHHGGIYLDTDVQVLKSFEALLKYPFFIASQTIQINENGVGVEPALMGSIKYHPWLKEVLTIYDSDELYQYPAYICPEIFAIALARLKNSELEPNWVPNEQLKQLASRQYGKYQKWSTFWKNPDWASDKMYYDGKNNIVICNHSLLAPEWFHYGLDSINEQTIAVHWNAASWWDIDNSFLEEKHLSQKEITYRKNKRYIKSVARKLIPAFLRRPILKILRKILKK
jgi:lipopolysaccharide biosynthesis glycosyltransferase